MVGVLDVRDLPMLPLAAEPARIAFALEPGDKTTIVAPAGSGKSSAARRLAGLVRSNDGAAITLGGRRLESLSRMERAQALALVPTEPSLLLSLIGRTVRRELELSWEFLGVEAEADRVDGLLRDLKLDTLADRSPATLSGGEFVRLGVACALAKDPAVLILDDSVSHLDPSADHLIHQVLSHQRSSRGLIVVEFLSRSVPRIGRQGEGVIFVCEGSAVEGSLETVWKQVAARAPYLLPPIHALAAYLMREATVVFDRAPNDAAGIAQVLDEWRQSRIMDPSQQRAPLEDRGAAALSVENLEFRYDGSPGFYLGPLTMSLRRSAIHALLGPNGAGKSTLLKCAGNILRPTRGVVAIGGVPRDPAEPLHFSAKASSFVFQHPDEQIFLATARQELLFTAATLRGRTSEATARGEEVAASLGIVDLLERSPLSLSRSQRKLLTLGGALTYGPEVLLVDEPTAGLDARQAARVVEALRSYASGGGCAIVISHDPDFLAEIAATVLVLAQGKVKAHVSAQEEWPSTQTSPVVAEVARQLGLEPVWSRGDLMNSLANTTRPGNA